MLPRLAPSLPPACGLALLLAAATVPHGTAAAQTTRLNAWQPTPLDFGTVSTETFVPRDGAATASGVIVGTLVQAFGGTRRSTWWSESGGVRPDDVPLEPSSTQFDWQYTLADGRLVGSEITTAGGRLHAVFDPATDRKIVLPPPPIAGAVWSTDALFALGPHGSILATADLGTAPRDVRSFACDLTAAMPGWRATGVAPPATGWSRTVIGGDIGQDGTIAVAYQDRDSGGNVVPALQVVDPQGVTRVEIDSSLARLVGDVRVLADGSTLFLYVPTSPGGAIERIGRRTAQGIEDLLVPSFGLRISGLQCDDRGRILCYGVQPFGRPEAGLFQDGRFQTFDALATDALALHTTREAHWISRRGEVLLPATDYASNPAEAVILRPGIEPVMSFHVDNTQPDADFDCIYRSTQPGDLVLRIDGAAPGVLWFLYFGDSRFGVPLGLPFHVGLTDANGSGELRFPRSVFSPTLFASQPDVLFLASALDPVYRLRATTVRRVTLR